MKQNLLPPLLLAILALGLASCTSLHTPVSKANTPKKTPLAKLKSSTFSLRKLVRKTPPIVEVKKDTPPAKKTAKKKVSKADLLAWKRKKAARKAKWTPKKGKALVPKDFDPADLDVDGQLPSYGILPSLNPDGGSTSIEDIEDSAILPADVANLPSIPSLPNIPSPATPSSAPDLSTVPDYLKPAGPVPAIQTKE